MAMRHEVISREYRDSVALMQLSAALAKMPGIGQASAVMGTENNLSLLRQAGMDIGPVAVSPNDLLIVVQGDDDALEAAIAAAKKQLSAQEQPVDQGGTRAMPPRSIAMALAAHADANLAMISTPGEYATAEALKALNLGLNVMLFSNNVSVPDEAMLKRTARDKGLIVMGPDCGTAIINGIPLAFANVVRRGAIGVVGASGTGLQEVTVLVDRLGGGISQAIGTGGHDQQYVLCPAANWFRVRIAYATGYRLGKGDPNIQNNYAGYLCRNGKAIEGEKLFLQVASSPLYRTPEVALVNAGVCSRSTGDVLDAERYFNKALAIRPNLPEAMLQLGNIAFDRGDADQARDIVKRYLGVNPPTAEVLWLGFRAERKLGDTVAAAGYARRVQSEYPDSQQAQMMRSGVDR